ncbi:mycoredoxin [Micromonospora pallida]|uniref:Mycoredoxin n=2 Tax=Micromonospora pallida TaxID=145854 RepID=A0A1C6SB70_9ACTN|nr:mycoredoxin [Micromonospora pallida]
MLAVGLAAATPQLAQGSPGSGALDFLLFAALAVLFSPLPFPRSVSAAEAQERGAVDGRPIVYWRPGCRYCLRLRARLGRDARTAHWVDIWRDAAGAAAVRRIAGGNETVPTVVVDGQPYVNPAPRWLRDQLRKQTNQKAA